MTDEAPSPDIPIYAVGDLHGCADALNRLLEQIDEDAAARTTGSVKLIFLGDYVDRGEQSRIVLESLVDLTRQFPHQVVCLKGNHEQMLLDFLDHPVERGRRWLRHGGLQTLASFGIGGVTERARAEALVEGAARLRGALPQGTEEWLRSLTHWWQSGNVVCVHAGMDPAVQPEHQVVRDMLWGHPLFERYTRPDELWVVHGHEIVQEAQVTKRRVACDTGAYVTGRLTAAALFPGEEIRFIST